MAATITLTTDWGNLDHYVSVVKGAIIRRLPEARIIDITHLIPTFDIKKAAFIIKNAYVAFPEKTIHIVGVNTEESESVSHVVIQHNGHFFIGADNGIFPLIFNEPPEQIIELNIPQDTGFFTFSTRDRFVKTAVHLAQGNDIKELGFKRSELTKYTSMQPSFEGNLLRARVIYIDNYENIFLNVTNKQFNEIGKERRFSLYIKGKPELIGYVSDAYGAVSEGNIVVIQSTTGYIEVAVNRGNASSLLGMKPDDMVLIEFHD